MITSKCADDDLTRQIMCSSLGGGKKMLTEIIETNEELGTSNFNNVISWKWAKAQLKVNEQRDKIDSLICEVVKAIVSEATLSETRPSETTLSEATPSEATPLDKTELMQNQLKCEADYLDIVKQRAQDAYEKYLAAVSFMYGLVGALIANVFVAYLYRKF